MIALRLAQAYQWEESPDSRKQGVERKLKRATASKSHRNYVGLTTLKVVRNE